MERISRRPAVIFVDDGVVSEQSPIKSPLSRESFDIRALFRVKDGKLLIRSKAVASGLITRKFG